VNNDVEFISKFQNATDYEPSAKPLIIVSENQGTIIQSLINAIGKFLVENDTLIPLLNNADEIEG
jgi:hypothetical protein